MGDAEIWITRYVSEGGPFSIFIELLIDPDIAVRRKIIFLLNTLILPTDEDQSSSSSNLSQPEHVHSNSHASMLSNPTNISTSPVALKALKDHGILSAVVSGLVTPIPYGEDGDQVDLDEDYEEKSIRCARSASRLSLETD